ncbi:hypothetical protein BTQ07_23745 [Escherichia coli]|nr:hypothetical protein BTQ07_23745 [Escherichia coli]
MVPCVLGLAGGASAVLENIEDSTRWRGGFGGFTPVPYETTECRLPCRWRGISRPTETSGSERFSDPCYFAIK